MERANVLTIPTIVHLMLADDTPFPKHNEEVRKTEEVFPQLLSSADDEKSVNAIWNPAALQFKLDRMETVRYHLRDFGLTAQQVIEEGEEIMIACSAPPTEAEQRVFRALQDRFGRRGFRGLQVFVLARVLTTGGDNIGGCAMSQPAGTIGSAWLDQVAVTDPAGFRILAHEIGHFLTLPHVESPKRLMLASVGGMDLIPDEIAKAKTHAHTVMNQ
jgi:hypothetical protein